ncbi:hypothetical protein LptCag_2389 [Leptospirillum ferriphilum]|uniref:Uncharacterized protein n=1 Tax=Leptospirillum ferriphilum TaxID=178606 RepID=A0A094WEI8_9BACT|nr:hypothetical protein LptCag_2389 [Leptospirillum ferriphilum]
MLFFLDGSLMDSGAKTMFYWKQRFLFLKNKSGKGSHFEN